MKEAALNDLKTSYDSLNKEKAFKSNLDIIKYKNHVNTQDPEGIIQNRIVRFANLLELPNSRFLEPVF